SRALIAEVGAIGAHEGDGFIADARAGIEGVFGGRKHIEEGAVATEGVEARSDLRLGLVHELIAAIKLVPEKITRQRIELVDGGGAGRLLLLANLAQRIEGAADFLHELNEKGDHGRLALRERVIDGPEQVLEEVELLRGRSAGKLEQIERGLVTRVE